MKERETQQSMTTISVRVSSKDRDKLEFVSHVSGKTTSVFMREALLASMDNYLGTVDPDELAEKRDRFEAGKLLQKMPIEEIRALLGQATVDLPTGE